MKKGLLALAGIFLLISCNEPKNSATIRDDSDNDHMAMAKQNSELSKGIYRAIETGDVSKLDSFITKDVIDHEGNNGKDIIGLDSLKNFLGNLHTYFDGMKMQIISDGTSLDGAYHFTLVNMKGKAKENPWGMPVGTDIDDMSMDLVKIKDGKASEHWSFTSQKDIMEMMSAMQGGGMPAEKNKIK